LDNHNIQEQIRQIMLSEELSDTEKLDRLRALIPLESFEIEDLSKATPAQLKQLKYGLAVTEAMQQLRRRTSGKRKRAIPLKTSATQEDVRGFDEGRDAVAYLKPHVLH
jgi:adenosine/AMP kinase